MILQYFFIFNPVKNKLRKQTQGASIKMKKKVLAAVLMGAMVFSMAACGSKHQAEQFPYFPVRKVPVQEELL